VDFGINSVDYLPQMLGLIHKVDLVYIHHQQAAFIVAVDPGLVPLVEAAEVVN
jgi:hypothetical protein